MGLQNNFCPYQVMGLQKGANIEEIRAKYISMSSLLHADKNSGPDVSANNAKVSVSHLNWVQAEHAFEFSIKMEINLFI
jgi:curved DNA-binding protein CbpA